jgi:hypothetical protein
MAPPQATAEEATGEGDVIVGGQESEANDEDGQEVAGLRLLARTGSVALTLLEIDNVPSDRFEQFVVIIGLISR